MFRYALTILLSAFLLFQVQPLIARYILPWFGGSPTVWTTCLLFFQMVLLLGYLYAHLLSTLVSRRTQTILHAFFLLVSLASLPIIPAFAWKQTGEMNPTFSILALLALTVGVPYLLLSTTGPLVQRWFSLARPGASPYRLYALSNVGSLAALLTYPVLFEPLMTLQTQAISWSVCYALFVLMSILCAWSVFHSDLSEVSSESSVLPSSLEAEENIARASETVSQKPGVIDGVMWLLLAACPSLLLLATTNQICQEVAVVPFLWILPLSLYLLSFIIAFDNSRWYFRPLWFGLMLLGMYGALQCLNHPVEISMPNQIAIFSGALFACAMTCHGELAASRPSPKYLTLFYLMIAVGGALGGVFVALLAPRLFSHYWELHFGLLASLAVSIVAVSRVAFAKKPPIRVFVMGNVVGAVVLLGFSIEFYKHTQKYNSPGSISARNFYGVASIMLVNSNRGKAKRLNNGRVQHGVQFLRESDRNVPTCYYTRESGVAAALDFHPNRREEGEPASLHVGVIGLGVGTVAAYGQPGDRMRFYEINPQVIEFAQENFSFLADSQADVSVVLGDARTKLEEELSELGSQEFDVLVIDAFTGDGIPMHLLTRECLQLYAKHLKPDGILAFHVTNHFLDLRLLVRALVEEAGYESVLTRNISPPGESYFFSSVWVLASKNPRFFQQREVSRLRTTWPVDSHPPHVWSDDYGSLLQVLK